MLQNRCNNTKTDSKRRNQQSGQSTDFTTGQHKTNRHEHQFDKKKHLTPLRFCSKILEVGNVMDKIYEQTMLFDFYGELLTEHQRSVYEDALYNDLSLSEIAQSRGISR